jgi:hypothetical protein
MHRLTGFKRLCHWIALLVVWGHALVPALAFMAAHNPQAVVGEDLCVSLRIASLSGTSASEQPGKPTPHPQHHCLLCLVHASTSVLALLNDAEPSHIAPAIWLGQIRAYPEQAEEHLPPDPAALARPIRAPPAA